MIKILGRTASSGKRLFSQEVQNNFLITGEAQLSRTFTLEDLRRFADVTGDHNPIHLCGEASSKFGFDRCVVHGALLNGLVSGLISLKIPNCVVIEQTLHFPNALLVDEPVNAILSLLSQRKRFINVKYVCLSASTTGSKEVLKGEAKLFL